MEKEQMKLDEDLKNQIIEEILPLIGSDKIPSLLSDKVWWKIKNDIWLLSEDMHNWIKRFGKGIQQENVKQVGLYLGTQRSIFGLSLECLYLIKDNIQRYIPLKGKLLEKFLYGKPIYLDLDNFDKKISDLDRIIVTDDSRSPIGISYIKINNESDNNSKSTIRVELKPIIDLGVFLRKEQVIYR